jgi:hypothetical protein
MAALGAGPGHCPRCGGARTRAHEACERALVLEPPRFCGNCGRRLRVQVFPDGFRALCPVHGPVGWGSGSGRFGGDPWGNETPSV